MRLARASVVAGAAALLTWMTAAVPAAQQDADKKVAGGGITVKGWQGRVDSGNRQGLAMEGERGVLFTRLIDGIFPNVEPLIPNACAHIIGVQKEAVLSATHSIVTVEEVVDELDAPPNAVILPHWVVSAVCEVPGGAHPSYAQGYSQRDNAFYKAWDSISRHREVFSDWMRRHILETNDFADYRARLRESRDA